jgi:cytochrome c
MKRIIVLSFTLVALIACGGNDSKDNKEEKKDKASELSDNPDYQKGVDILSKNNCGTCHKVDEPVTGPTFREIANKYAPASDSVINYLANKIINGGTGVWGQVPMTPHPELNEADAKAIVKYILLLKK